MSSFQESIKRISKELTEMSNRLQIILSRVKDERPSSTPRLSSLVNVSPQSARREESLLGPILDATKMSLKLIQANSLELLTSMQSLLPADSDFQKQLHKLEQRFHIKLNYDIENRAIEMVRANREFITLVTDVLKQYSEDLKFKELRELQQRQEILREKKEEHSRLQDEMRETIAKLEKERSSIKENLVTVEAERDKLEGILSHMLKEIRLVKFSEEIEIQNLLIHDEGLMTSFQEVYELNKCSFSVLKFGTWGPEVVCSDKLSFKPPETSWRDQNDWLIGIGAYYFTIIGQGEGYARGFFGPLPVRDHDDYMAYIYSFLAKDPTNLDKRTSGKSYILFCFFLPKTINIAYSSYELMKNTLDFIISDTKTIDEIDSELLAALRESLIGVLTEKALDSSNIDRESQVSMQEVLVQSGLSRIILLALDRPTLKRSLANLLEQVWSTLQSFDVKNLKINLSNGAQIQGKLIQECSRGFGLARPWRNIDAAVVLVSKDEPSWADVHSFEKALKEITDRGLPLGVLTPISTSKTKISEAKKQLFGFITDLAVQKRLSSSVYSGEISVAQLKKIFLALGARNRVLAMAMSQKS
ncbi:MAG: hypothetical protein ACFFB3_17015 [Candidatus Hodarchaeota archaeon]